jgi:hypothetical protein
VDAGSPDDSSTCSSSQLVASRVAPSLPSRRAPTQRRPSAIRPLRERRLARLQQATTAARAGKQGRRGDRSRRRTVDAEEMRTFGESQVHVSHRRETRIHCARVPAPAGLASGGAPPGLISVSRAVPSQRASLCLAAAPPRSGVTRSQRHSRRADLPPRTEGRLRVVRLPDHRADDAGQRPHRFAPPRSTPQRWSDDRTWMTTRIGKRLMHVLGRDRGVRTR